MEEEIKRAVQEAVAAALEERLAGLSVSLPEIKVSVEKGESPSVDFAGIEKAIKKGLAGIKFPKQDLSKVEDAIHELALSISIPDNKETLEALIEAVEQKREYSDFPNVFEGLEKFEEKMQEFITTATRPTVVSTGNPVQYIYNADGEVISPDEVEFKDSANLDAFGRLRVANPTTIFDSKQIFDNQPLFWDDQEVSGSGTTSTHSTAEARTRLAVSADTAGKRVRQTFMRFNYQPAKSQLIYITTKMSAAQDSGIKASVGLFDDDNGIFFTNDGGTVKAVQRSSTSGSAVDTEVNQVDWNIDSFDGTGPSGITLDPTKTQILIFDYEWLGVGRVRMGFVVDGKFYYVHQFLNTNNLSTVYMSTPNLPIRYELENDGTGGATTMDHICSSVVSEGGQQSLGTLRSYNMGNNIVNANTAGTKYALFGIRLKSGALSAAVDFERLTVLPTTNDHFIWELILNPTVAGTFTYSDETNSVVQIAAGDTSGNPSTNTVTSGTIIDSGYGVDNVPVTAALQNAIRLGAAIDDTPDEIVLAVTPLSANMDIHGSLTWRELS